MKNRNEIIGKIFEYNRNRYRKEEYPALLLQYEEWQKTEPLKGMRILDGTPLYNNTLMKYIPLLAAGAELTAATHDSIPFDRNVIPLLEQWGIPHVHNDRTGKYDCILDCGGVHASLDPEYGFAELTRSGFYHYQHASKPVILVDDSRIKAIETCLGTGNGFLRGMQQMGYQDLQGKKITIFGFGKVGRGIAFYAGKAGAEITIIDGPEVPVPENFRKADRNDFSAVADAVRSAWCVVTATGIRDAMKGNGAAEILKNSSQIVVAMGIENEWGDSLPPSRILNGGKPLNFILEEPTKICYIDPTMSLLNAAALELVTKQLPAGIQKIDPNVEAHYWQAAEQCGFITDELRESGI